MKKWFKRIVKAALYLLLFMILFLIGSTFLNDILYHFKRTSYNNELIGLFNKDRNDIYVEHKYQSGQRGTIYCVSIGSSKFLLIEANNFINIDPSKLQVDSIDRIKKTDGKTYSIILWKNYPVVEAALNPKKSGFLKILVLKPNHIELEEGKDNHFYLTGNLRSVVFSNSQLCYIITSSKIRELLVLTFNNKLYFIIGQMEKYSLLELINPKYL
ncbi:MAG: hypothetical protein U0T33_13410 [Bacteroidales bacterium]